MRPHPPVALKPKDRAAPGLTVPLNEAFTTV